MKDKASSVIVEVADNNLTRGGHILHEQEYNTRHGISAIPDEIRREIRHQPCQQKVQQKPVVYLLLEGALGWKCFFPGLPVPASSQPSEPAHRSRIEADKGYAPPQSRSGYGGTLAPAPPKRLYPTSRKPFPGHAQIGLIPTAGTQSSLQAQALRADDLSRSAGSDRRKSRSALLYCRSSAASVSVHRY